jgi:predicted ATPase
MQTSRLDRIERRAAIERPIMHAKKTLPAQTTSFVGRDVELSLIAGSFAEGGRLVTLLGPPGIGKSRLSLRYAELVAASKDASFGIFVCDLVEASTAEDLCAALSRAIDVVVGSEARGSDRVAELGVRLAGLGDALIILDNFERLVSVGPETVGRWLRVAGKTRFLVTSRERLRLTGEAIHEIGPLALPENERDMARSEAVQLFVERARAVRPTFAIGPENAAVVAEIVKQLDGIPLAVELGASRMAVLSPAKLLERMPRRLELLSGGLRNPNARQRTLREAIDASYRLLEPLEQSALAQLAAFRGGFGLEAAEAVVDLSAFPGAPPVLDVIESLAGKSLVFVRTPEAFPEETRFGLYLSIRDYAEDRLEERGERREVLRRHADYFLSLASGLCEDEGEAPGLDQVRRIALERENLIALHHRLLLPSRDAPAKSAEALNAALALECVLTRWGPVSTLHAMIDEALRAGNDIEPKIRLRGLLSRASTSRLLGRMEESSADYEAAAELARSLGDPRLRGVAEAGLGSVLREQGRLREAAQTLEGAIKRLSACGERRWLGRARNALGYIRTVVGDVEGARALHEDALKSFRQEGDRELAAVTLLGLAINAIAEGQLDEAAAHIEEARAGAPEPSSPAYDATYLRASGLLRQEQGRLAEARGSIEASISLSRELGNVRMEGFSLGHLGTIHAEMGDLVQARAALERATALLSDVGDVRAVALFTAALGAARARLGHLVEADRIFAGSGGLPEAQDDALLKTAIDLYGAQIELERAARVEDEASRAAGIAVVRSKIAQARGEAGRRDPGRSTRAGSLGGSSHVDRSHHVRVALRLLERSLAERAPAAPEASPSPGAVQAPPPQAPGARPPERVLVVSPDARWCRLPNGAEVEFTKGRALRLMLVRLFEERLRAPGHALTIDALFASGWPGERASAEAIENRVYVGISRLRKLGFKGLLLSRDDGFLLDPAVPSYCADRPF